MYLSAFNYKESGWELENLAPLNPINLLVARNATGKSRTIRAIQNVVSFLQMKEFTMGSRTFITSMTFCKKEDSNWQLNYTFHVKNSKIEYEYLKINNDVLIFRDNNISKYKDVEINPPAEKLVVQTRRDQSLYPEIEELMQWVEGVQFVYCSDINPLIILGMDKFGHSYTFSALIDSLSKEEINMVIDEAKSLGYHLESLKTVRAVSDVKLVLIKEKSVHNEMLEMQLSNGMLRVLYLLCFTAVIKHNNRLSMLLIDDLGEGLDYRKSVGLGKIIFEDCKENNVQLIVSSNDALLMDVVDINNWQVLSRDKSKVTTMNYKTNPELFNAFRMTGLSNFDLFSSDFINNYSRN